MTVIFMTDPATGRCALYDLAPGVVNAANYQNPNSDINAPLNNPTAHLDKIYFHSDLDYLEVLSDTIVVVSHAAVSSVPAPTGVGLSSAFGWNDAPVNRLLLTHGLGYIPHVMVVANGKILYPGMPVQTGGIGSARYCSPIVSATEVRLYEYASVGAVALPATSVSYQVLVFKQPPAASGNLLLDFNPITGTTQMGLGKFNSKRRYLQAVPGGTPFGLPYGRTIDLKNGSPRFVLADGSFYEPVPVVKFYVKGTYNGALGPSSAYNGAYAGPEFIQVQAP